MSAVTSVFICYKKVLASHNSHGEIVRREDSRAEILHEILERASCDPGRVLRDD